MGISFNDVQAKIVQAKLARHTMIQTTFGDPGDTSQTGWVSAAYDTWANILPGGDTIYIITDLNFDVEALPNVMSMSFRHESQLEYSVDLTSERLREGLSLWAEVTKFEPFQYRIRNPGSSARYLGFTWRLLVTDSTKIEKIRRLLNADIIALELLESIDTRLAYFEWLLREPRRLQEVLREASPDVRRFSERELIPGQLGPTWSGRPQGPFPPSGQPEQGDVEVGGGHR